MLDLIPSLLTLYGLEKKIVYFISFVISAVIKAKFLMKHL
jgi:hypothetical protein